MRTWLKKAREKKKFTHEQVAHMSKVSRSYYTNIENGVKTPSVIAAKAIADVLGVPWSFFYEDKSYLKEQNAKEVI